jgi:hypothetical protein
MLLLEVYECIFVEYLLVVDIFVFTIDVVYIYYVVCIFVLYFKFFLKLREHFYK